MITKNKLLFIFCFLIIISPILACGVCGEGDTTCESDSGSIVVDDGGNSDAEVEWETADE